MVREKIEAKFGTLNNFCEKKHGEMLVSRTHLYKLLTGSEINPTIGTLVNLSELTGIPLCEICEEFAQTYKENCHADSKKSE